LATPLIPAPRPSPASATVVHGMCLLHADYHPMDGRCWKAIADFFFAHAELTEQQARELYLLEVERAMLDNHIRSHVAGPAGGSR